MNTQLIKRFLLFIAACAGYTLLPVLHSAAQTSAISFERDIQPIFAARCISCHNEKKSSGGLRLDSQINALQGGKSGAAIVAGNAAASLLYQRLIAPEGEQMPPVGERLSAAQIALLKAWIEAEKPAAGKQQSQTNIANHWAWQPIQKPPIPSIQNPKSKTQNPIDAFIANKLAQAGFTMSPEADRRTLIRRLYFDLIGLPPTPEQLQNFVASRAPNAYEKLVDELLSSPRYGERWARHWLDIVHYGDTHGYDKDKPRPHAWPYRDYVIRALNEDKPYARFVEEQIAGDVLYPNTRDGVQALGFLSAGPWDFIGHAELPESKIDGKIARHLDRDDMVANTIGTFNSVTVHCAQCHNHKFDPISQEDYYAVQAVFAALDRADKKYFPQDTALTKKFNALEGRQRDLAERKRVLERDAAKTAGEAVTKIDAQIAEATKKQNNETELKTLRAARAQIVDAALSPQTRAERDSYNVTLAQLNQELANFPAPEIVYAGTVHYGTGTFIGTGANGGRPRPIHILARGQVTTPGRTAEPGALALLSFQPARFVLPPDADEGQRRAALAHWLTDKNNPLTWRSIVNRVWQYHFGAGLVTTPNDFGNNGAKPSHPELLDWLAAEFRDTGGSLKKLHKLIVMSATYRQTSDAPPNTAPSKIRNPQSTDSSNTLLWRQNRRKLEAEAVRDTILSVTGKLDLTMGGAGWQDFVIEHPEHSPHYEYGLADPEDKKTWRRSIYRFIVRSQTQPWMTALDCADPSIRVDKRNESLSPLQALALLNNGFMISQARHFAERLQNQSPNQIAAQIDGAYWLALGRAPTSDERKKMIPFIQTYGLPNFCRVLLNLNEFSFVD